MSGLNEQPDPGQGWRRGPLVFAVIWFVVAGVLLFAALWTGLLIAPDGVRVPVTLALLFAGLAALVLFSDGLESPGPRGAWCHWVTRPTAARSTGRCRTGVHVIAMGDRADQIGGYPLIGLERVWPEQRRGFFVLLGSSRWPTRRARRAGRRRRTACRPPCRGAGGLPPWSAHRESRARRSSRSVSDKSRTPTSWWTSCRTPQSIAREVCCAGSSPAQWILIKLGSGRVSGTGTEHDLETDKPAGNSTAMTAARRAWPRWTNDQARRMPTYDVLAFGATGEA